MVFRVGRTVSARGGIGVRLRINEFPSCPEPGVHFRSEALPRAAGNSHPKTRRETHARWPQVSLCGTSDCLCVQRQAAVVSVLLSFFGLGIFALEVSERHVQPEG